MEAPDSGQHNAVSPTMHRWMLWSRLTLARGTHSVDDLEDIGALEQYVEESAAMLLFLSKDCEGCLKSYTPLLAQIFHHAELRCQTPSTSSQI